MLYTYTNGAIIIVYRLKRPLYKIFNFSIWKVILFFRQYFIPFSEENFLSNFHRIPQTHIKTHLRQTTKFQNAVVFTDRYKLWEYIAVKLHESLNDSKKLSSLGSENSFTGGVVLEFGVYNGESINALAKLLPNASIYGFDSFLGLQEDWHGTNYGKGHFNLSGITPAVETNVKLINGWFNETLPEFLDNFQLTKLILVHMDADTYTPTSFVLNELSYNIRKGTIIIFDEYFGYSKSWKEHEYKAFKEFSKKYKLNYNYLALTNIQAAIEIL